MRARALLVLLLVLAGLAGCASVPESSPVQVLRRVGDGDAPVLPPGPVDGSNALDLVRGFVYASGSSPDRHGAARRFLAPEAADWDDGTGVTVLTEQFDTVYPTSVDPESGMRTVRIRGTALGRLTPGGWFEASQAPVQIDVNVVRRDGQWRIARLPGGVLVRMSDFRVNYRTVKTWFVDPVRRVAVPDLRYLPGSPARAQAARAMELLLAGPSTALQGAASTMFVTNAQLRSNVAASPDGALIVDLTQLGDLDEAGRRLLAAQVVLSLAEVSVGRVRLLADGAPLLPDRPDLTRDDVASLIAEPAPTTVPALVVYNGRVHQLNGGQLDTALPGPIGNGEVAVQSAASSPDGRRVAVVAADGPRRRLLLGGAEGAVGPRRSGGGDDEPAVVGAQRIRGLDGPGRHDGGPGVLDPDGNARVAPVNARELTGMGPIQDLRLSRDGLRVAAVVRGGLYTAALARSPDGDVTVRNVRSVAAVGPGRGRRGGLAGGRDDRGGESPHGRSGLPGVGGRADLGPAARQQPHAAAARGRRRAEPARAGDGPVRGVELRGRGPRVLAPARGRRPGRGAALPRLTRRVPRPAARLLATTPPVDNSAVPAVVGPVPSSPSGTLAACPPPRTLLRRCRPAFCSPPCSTCSCPAPAVAVPRPGRGGVPAAPPGSARSGGRCCPVARRSWRPAATAVRCVRRCSRTRSAGGGTSPVRWPRCSLPRSHRPRARRRCGWYPRPPGRPQRAPAAVTTCSGCAGSWPGPTPGCGWRRRCGSVGGRATRSGWTPRRASRTSPGGSASTRGHCLRAPATVILVDDVVTTGATLRACRAALVGAERDVTAAVVLADATTPSTSRNTRLGAGKTTYCRTCTDRGHSNLRSVAGL